MFVGDKNENINFKNMAVSAVRSKIRYIGRILRHDIIQFRCHGSGTTLKQDK